MCVSRRNRSNAGRYVHSGKHPNYKLWLSEESNFEVGYTNQVYYQRNQKLNEVAGSLGGLLNAIFLFGKVLCIAYNSLFLKFKIIKSAFLMFS